MNQERTVRWNRKIVSEKALAEYLEKVHRKKILCTDKFAVQFRVECPYCSICGKRDKSWKKGRDKYCCDASAHYAKGHRQLQGEIVYEETWDCVLTYMQYLENNPAKENYMTIEKYDAVDGSKTEANVVFDRIQYLTHSYMMNDEIESMTFFILHRHLSESKPSQ